MAGRALRRDVYWITGWPSLYFQASVEPIHAARQDQSAKDSRTPKKPPRHGDEAAYPTIAPPPGKAAVGMAFDGGL